MNRTSTTAWAVILIAACGLVAYSNSFTDLFLGLDGKQSIRDNPHIRHVWPLSEAISLPMWEAPAVRTQYATVAMRPTLSISLALTNYLFGFTPKAHHGVNIATHIIAALLLFGVVRQTLRRIVSTDDTTFASTAVALIWLVHPLQTESVTYIIQRSESLMGALVLLSVYCCIRATEGHRTTTWQVAAVVACLLATTTKPTAAVTPFIVALFDYTFPSRRTAGWARPSLYLALAGAAWLPHLAYANDIRVHTGQIDAFGFVMAQPRVILHYLRLTIWPDDLYLYINTELFNVDSVAPALIAALPLALLFALATRLLWRRHWTGFALAWFFVTLGPVATILPMTDFIQEHRMYLPLAGLAALAVGGGHRLVERAARQHPKQRRLVGCIALLAVVLFALGARTWTRNWDYHREFGPIHSADIYENYTILADHFLSKPALIQAEAKRAQSVLADPKADDRDISFAHFVLGLAHWTNFKFEKAAVALQRVVDREPEFGYGHYNLGEVRRELNEPAAAIEHFRRALELEPKLVFAHKGLALALADTGHLQGAEEALRTAMEIQPGFVEGLMELAVLATKRGSPAEAAQHLAEAIVHQPMLPEAHYELAKILMEQGDLARARLHFTESLRLRAENAEAHHRLAEILRLQNDHIGATEHYREAIRLQPNFVHAHKGLALALQATGDREAAEAQLREAIRIRPEFDEGHLELGFDALQRGDLAAAARHYEEAVRQNPELVEAYLELGRIALQRLDSAKAAKWFGEAVQREPSLEEARIELGNALMNLGDATSAVEQRAAVVQARPGDGEARRQLGAALFAAGDRESAADHLREAVRLAPSSASGHFDLGIALGSLGQLQAAAEQFAEVIRLEPGFAEAHYELGIIYRDTGDIDGAIEHLIDALHHDPEFGDARTDLDALLEDQNGPGNAAECRARAAALADGGDIKSALRLLRIAVYLDPADEESHLELGVMLQQAGDTSGAVASLEEALRLDPEHSAPHYELGLLWRDAGELTKAAQHLREALRLAPDSSEARADLREVERELEAR